MVAELIKIKIHNMVIREFGNIYFDDIGDVVLPSGFMRM